MKLFLSLLFASLTTTACADTPKTPATTPASAAATTPTAVAPTTSDSLKNVHYTAADSAEVVQLLRAKVEGESDVLFYARHFIGRPYVGATLEICDPEQLVVNLRELDCTTFAETVLALTMTKRQQQTSFAAYCHNLERLRYRNGQMNGYLSRLHYFTWWMHDNVRLGLVADVSQGQPHATAPINVRDNYMSTHATAYKFLAAHPEWTDSIAALERAENGPDGYYIPEQFTNLPASKLTEVRDGDLLAIVTTKAGLDYSHLGFAAWGKDGRLHLLNASSVYHRVVEDTVTLHDYLARRKTSVGIRPLRLTVGQ